MNYDRLLQLGGIDREVPPIPGYISKEELKEDIDGINGKIPEEASTENQLADKEYVDEESAFQKNISAIMSLAVDPNAGVTTVTTNPEWKLVYTDSEDRILLGKRQDNTWYFAADLDTILDTVISGYTTS